MADRKFKSEVSKVLGGSAPTGITDFPLKRVSGRLAT